MANFDTLIDKTGRAAQSAALLLDNKDIDGARAAMLIIGASQESTRTHGGLIDAFGLHLVKTGLVDRSLGHVLNRAHEIRLIADYTGDLVDPELAAWVISQAAVFVAAMRKFADTQR